jgi:hypothetical protein
MSFTNMIDTAYASGWMTRAEEDAYEREHACHEGKCKADPADTHQCESCGDYYCAAHITTEVDRVYVCARCVAEEIAYEAAHAERNAAWLAAQGITGIAADAGRIARIRLELIEELQEVA